MSYEISLVCAPLAPGSRAPGSLVPGSLAPGFGGVVEGAGGSRGLVVGEGGVEGVEGEGREGAEGEGGRRGC